MLEEPRIQLLGPVQLHVDGRPAPIGGPGVRGLLALLALRPNRIVALDDLIDALWNHDPPPTARTIVHGNISQLRRALRPAGPARVRIDTVAPGYRLSIDPMLIDVHRARALFARAGAAPLTERAELLAEAYSLWQGRELGGVPESLRAPELADLRTAVHGARVDADLALGRHGELIDELTAIVREDPGRERTTGQLMRALHASGRRADALEVYRSAARFASERLGLDPGPELRALHQQVLDDDLPPPAVTVTRMVPRQLPPATPLAGRSADLAWLDGVDGVAVVTGPPGIGKSALAVAWAHHAIARFPDGILFATLRGFDSQREPVPVAEVLTQFLLGLGVPPPELPESEDERLASYRSLAGGRRMLVVLDDARSAEQVRPLLPPGPGSMAVVTSRARLDGLAVSHGARVRPLEPLASPDAVRLIADVAGAAFAEHHEQLARLCEGLPLALRITGARLAAGPAWTVPEFVAELASERTRLAALDVDDAGVRAALDVSLRGLPPEVGSVFRALGAFPGATVGPFVVAALCSVPVSEARRRLRVLAAHHLLVESGPGVFTQHDLVRLYQRELAGSPSPGLSRVVRYYQAAADRARRRLLRIVDPLDFSDVPVELPRVDGFDEALAWFVAEWPNLLATLEAAAAAGLHDDVWRLARVVHTYRVVRPLWDEWRRVVSLGMAAAEACGDAGARFWMLISRCALSLTFDLGAASLDDASAALAMAGADPRRRICALIHVGCALNSCGRHEEAVDCLVRAISAASGDDELRGQALANCAEAEKAAGRYASAIAHQLESLEIDRRLGDESYVVVSLNNLAEAYFRSGDEQRASACATEAVELAARRGFLLQEAVGRLSIGRILRRRGDAEGARLQLRLAAELHSRVSPRPAPEILAELEALGVPAEELEEAASGGGSGLQPVESAEADGAGGGG
ncbi:AfsR/SARP family transcriptional regulator [Amycolatopsis thermophila]|uniref:DNA-binding SARP family transcriptional activator n=1 Tax=Amycolatopsis thermophila TaxID=206084 RepID=A0ABU0EU54_9PSEU|nr:BTAD domain-containing putative transcriptional regulator [Amycolatopsis thermophila]MDQ0378844.1 DNA-binding SARP family transcriptional activator [Amycolatopsis thermophila]